MAQSLNPNSGFPQSPSSSFPAGTPAKSPAKRLLPILVGGAGLILLGGGGILVGLNSKLTALQTSAQQKDAEVSDSEQIAHRYQTTLDNYTQTQDHIKFLEASVPDKSYVPTLLAQLQSLAGQTHLSVGSMRPTLPPPVAAAAPVAAAPAGGAASDSTSSVGPKKALPPPYDTLNIDVDVAGSYADTNMFLYSLTRFPKIISVNGVQMHPGAAAAPGGPVPVATTLKLTAYMFHDADPSAAPAGSPAAPASPAIPIVAVVPPASDGTVAGAAGRAATGAVAVTKESNSRSAAPLNTL